VKFKHVIYMIYLIFKLPSYPNPKLFKEPSPSLALTYSIVTFCVSIQAWSLLIFAASVQTWYSPVFGEGSCCCPPSLPAAVHAKGCRDLSKGNRDLFESTVYCLKGVMTCGR
jgi:hypothetical protein